jgi:glutamate-1-semialdehyde 2,1-aminomutase
MQEIIRRGVLATSLVVSYSHSEADIDQTVDAFAGAFEIYRRALDEGIDKHLKGRPVRPAIRSRA